MKQAVGGITRHNCLTICIHKATTNILITWTAKKIPPVFSLIILFILTMNNLWKPVKNQLKQNVIKTFNQKWLLLLFSLDQSHEMSNYWSRTQLFHECLVFGDSSQPPHSYRSYSSSSWVPQIIFNKIQASQDRKNRFSFQVASRHRPVSVYMCFC